MNLNVNGRLRPVPAEWQDETLLDVLREPLGLVGAKFGCGVGLCGACTVLVCGAPTRSCTLSARDVGPRAVLTVEGLAADVGGADAPAGAPLHPVQAAWLELSVPQCGYCQAGQIMATVALLRRVTEPSDRDIDEALSWQLCRCGTQQRIRQAVKRAAGLVL
jgi:isoquinoline 1-oxidoreductase alpha subunit